MSIKEYIKTILLIVLIILIGQIVYKTVWLDYKFLTLANMLLIISYVAMYFLSSYFLSKEVKVDLMKKQFNFFILLALFVYSTYVLFTSIAQAIVVWPNTLYLSSFTNFEFKYLMFEPYYTMFLFLFSAIIITLTSSLMKAKLRNQNTQKDVLANNSYISSSLLFLGLLFIINRDIFLAISEYLRHPNSISVLWIIDVKHLFRDSLVLVIFYKLISYIEIKYSVQFKNRFLTIITVVILSLSLYSFHMLVEHLNTIIFDRWHRSLSLNDWREFSFIPILISFYFGSKFCSREDNNCHSFLKA